MFWQFIIKKCYLNTHFSSCLVACFIGLSRDEANHFSNIYSFNRLNLAFDRQKHKICC